MSDRPETPVLDHAFYKIMLKRRTALIAVLLGLAALLLVLNIALGSSPISLGEVFRVLLTGTGTGGTTC